MNTPAPPPVDPGLNGSTAVARLGFTRDQVVQEFGYDSDVDDEFRFAVEDLCGAEMEDEDLGDALVDMVGVLDDGGFVVLLTPKASAEEVDASDIDEAAVTSGLHPAGTFTASEHWRAHKLVAPKAPAKR